MAPNNLINAKFQNRAKGFLSDTKPSDARPVLMFPVSFKNWNFCHKRRSVPSFGSLKAARLSIVTACVVMPSANAEVYRWMRTSTNLIFCYFQSSRSHTVPLGCKKRTPLTISQEQVIDINNPLVGIAFFVVTVTMILVARSLREYMPLVRRKRAQQPPPPGARELEVKIKLSAGPNVLDDLHELASMYAKAGQYDEAMRYCLQAIQVAENHFGKTSETLVPILKLYSRVLKRMHRHAEAANAKKRAEQCATK